MPFTVWPVWVTRPNLRMHNEEGASFLARRAREVEIGSREPIDLLFLDVFDGADDIPPAFTAPGMRCSLVTSMLSHLFMRMARPIVTTACKAGAGSKFLAHLSAALHPSHGTLVANMHCGDRPNLGAALLRTLRGQAPQLIDVEAPDGREVLRVASLFRCALPCMHACRVLGTPASCSPEQARRAGAGKRCLGFPIFARPRSSATLSWSRAATRARRAWTTYAGRRTWSAARQGTRLTRAGGLGWASWQCEWPGACCALHMTSGPT